MGSQKAVVANPTQYPPIIKGYYAQAFKKDKSEKALLKNMKKLNKRLIKEDYGGEYNNSQLNKILNPRNLRLKD